MGTRNPAPGTLYSLPGTSRFALPFLALLLAVAPLHAQRGEAGGMMRDLDRPGPVELLLRQQDRLGLSGEQVARLEVVRAALDQRNLPLVAELVRIRRQMREERGRRERREWFDEARPLMRRIRENNRNAMEAVGDILTVAQKDQLRDLLRERRKEHGDRDRDRRRG